MISHDAIRNALDELVVAANGFFGAPQWTRADIDIRVAFPNDDGEPRWIVAIGFGRARAEGPTAVEAIRNLIALIERVGVTPDGRDRHS